jgi:rare lipoprotein A
VVRVNDRGPFKNGRIIDLSRKAAQLLDFEAAGTAKVRVEILEAESRQFAAIAQGHVIAESAPKAVPVITVDAVPLAPPVAAAPVDRAAEADSAESTAPDTATEEPGAPKQVQSAKLATGPASRPRLRRRSAAAARRTSVSGSPSLAMARPQGVSDWDTGGGGPLAETAEPGARIITIPWPDGTVSQFPIERTSMFIQVGAFLRRDLATRLSARMSVLGRARVTQVELEDRLFFRVRLGPIASLEEADKLLAIVQSSGFNEARVIVD